MPHLGITLCRTVVLVAALLIGPAAPSARAQSLVGRSTTLVHGYVRPGDADVGAYLLFSELLEVRTQDLGLPGLHLNASFWGRADALDLEDTHRVTGDLNTLFVRYEAPAEGPMKVLHGLQLTVGRQFVALGPTLLSPVDGGLAHYLHPSGFELALFGGAPTGIRLDTMAWPTLADAYSRDLDWLVGGRVGYVNLGFLSGGASYIYRSTGDLTAESDLGVDVTASPLSFLDISGLATLSLEALRMKEARGTLGVRPLSALSVVAGYRFSSPDLWVPRSSIFSVFSEETFQEAFVEARYRVGRTVTLDGAYGRRFYAAPELDPEGRAAASGGVGEPGGANRASARASYRHLAGARAMAEVERVEMLDNASNRLRVAGSLPFALAGQAVQVVVDLDAMVLDEPLRGSRFSFVGGGYLKVPVVSGLTLLAGGSGGTTPLLRSLGTFTVRLTWEVEAGPSRGPTQVLAGRGR